MLDLFTRVVIDTNIWVSAFLRPDGAPAQLLMAAVLRRFRVIMSSAMTAELRRVVARHRIARRINLNGEQFALLLQLLERYVEIVPISGRLHISRDPKDDMVIETAIAGRAGYLVSRDEDITRDLRVINYLRSAGIEVLTVAQFLTLLDRDAE